MNQVAVVTGGEQTLGANLCLGLAGEGHTAAGGDLTIDQGANVAIELNDT